MHFIYFGSCVLPDPFCQFLILNGVRKGQQDLMKELQSFIGLRQIRCEGKGIAEPLEIFMVTRSPVLLSVALLCFQETGNAFDFPEVFHIADIFELILIAEADLIYHVIEPFDDVEGINTDPGIREVLFGDGDEAVTHVTAEVSYLFALLWRELMEVPVQIYAGGLVQDIDDGVCIAVRNTAVILVEIPSAASGVPDAAVSLELVNADSFRKFFGQTKADGFKYRLNGIGRDIAASCSFRKRDGFQQIQKDGIIKSLCDVKRGMYPIRSFVEGRAAVFAEQATFMESDGRTAVAVRNVSYRLPGTGVLDDAVGGTTVRTETLLRHGEIKGDQVIVPKGFYFFDSCFLWKFC